MNTQIKGSTNKSVKVDYHSALKEFVKMTIHNPDFFAKSRKTQYQQAKETIEKYKL